MKAVIGEELTDRIFDRDRLKPRLSHGLILKLSFDETDVVDVFVGVERRHAPSRVVQDPASVLTLLKNTNFLIILSERSSSSASLSVSTILREKSTEKFFAGSLSTYYQRSLWFLML